MGPKEFHKNCLGGLKSKPTLDLDALQGLHVGVDVSIWLHALCSIDDVAVGMNMEPTYPPDIVVPLVQSWHTEITSHNATLKYFFDGCDHPMKSITRRKRHADLQAARDWLQSFYAKGLRGEPITEEDRNKALTQTKKATYPDERVKKQLIDWMKGHDIEFECAPFEAEWQLVYALREGQIDAIMSTDGDCIVLGASCIFIKDNNARGPRKFHLYKKDEVLAERSPYVLRKYPETDWPFLSILFGNDYVDRIPNAGPQTILKKIFPPGLHFDTVEATTADIVARLVSRKFLLPDGYKEQVTQAVFLHQHCPILDDRKILIPLNPLPATGSVSWGKLIGFGDDPAQLLPLQSSEYARARSFDGCSFQFGRGLRDFDTPTYALLQGQHPMPISSQTVLPRYAFVDFAKIPIPCLHSSVLQAFIAARLGYNVAATRTELEEEVRQLIAIGKNVLEPERVPIQIGIWQVHEILKIKSIEEADWQEEGYYDLIKAKLKPITDVNDVRQFFPLGNEHNRERAYNLVTAGAVNVHDVSYITALSRADDSEYYVFKVHCVPSQKTKVVSANILTDEESSEGYYVFVSFDTATGTVQRYPFSICGCYDGRGFCSHLLASLLVFELVQYSKNKAEFEECMPVSPVKLQGVPTLAENFTAPERDARKQATKDNHKR